MSTIAVDCEPAETPPGRVPKLRFTVSSSASESPAAVMLNEADVVRLLKVSSPPDSPEIE